MIKKNNQDKSVIVGKRVIKGRSKMIKIVQFFLMKVNKCKFGFWIDTAKKDDQALRLTGK